MFFIKKSNLFLVSLLLSSCGYHAANSSGDEKRVVSIPVIQEDDDGVLRNTLARAISATGKYRYSSNDAPAELVVKFENTYTDTIGYAWDVNAATGVNVNRLYQSEGRKTIVALITLKNAKTGDLLVEPFRVSAQVNYDFVNPSALKNIEFTNGVGSKETTLHYSLGQLDSEEGARSEATHPLYQELANKIAEVLVRAPPYKREKA